MAQLKKSAHTDSAPAGEDASSWPSEQARAAAWGKGQEQADEVEAVVRGSIPDWVTGTLVYNGEREQQHGQPATTTTSSSSSALANHHAPTAAAATASYAQRPPAGGGDYSQVRHMFDGYGLLSRLRVQGGRAWGNQRYVQSKAFRAYKAQGAHCVTQSADLPGTACVMLPCH
jgi:carotenoid cleavage dioxygenase-like enzyme